MEKFTAVILAAGKGVRMKSSLPKVLHETRGRPMLHYVIGELSSLKKYIKQIIVVVGYKGDLVRKSVNKEFKNVTFVNQKVISGTASAVKCAKPKIRNKNVLVLCGDAPLITKETLARFLKNYTSKKLKFSFITAHLGGENDLGAVVRDSKGFAKAISEKDQASYESRSSEINSGIYAFKRDVLFKNLAVIKRNKKKKEYFLTDLIDILYQKGIRIKPYFLKSSEEVLGINSQSDLSRAEKVIQRRIIERFLEAGVRVLDADSTFIDEGVKIGQGTVIFPFTFIEKDVIIGSNCSLGPFVHLRKGTKVKEGTFLGNFIEINRSQIGKDVTMKHFGYLGDATVGNKVNIGAGTVVANYDGKKKHKTFIDKGAFIGSDTVLIAPVKVGKSASTGAGSVVTKNVKAKTVVAGVPARTLKKKR